MGLVIVLVVGIVFLVSLNYLVSYADNGFTLKEVFFLISILVGGFLGPYYFFGRINYEESRDKRERKRKRVKVILEYYETYNNNVHKILCLNVTNENELNEIRNWLRTNLSMIQYYVDKMTSYFDISDAEMELMLLVFSFVDKSELIMSEDLNRLRMNVNLSTNLLQYQDVFVKSRKYWIDKEIEMDELR